MMTRLLVALAAASVAGGCGSDTVSTIAGHNTSEHHEASGYQCAAVGSSQGDGFFSLETFGSKVYAGQFGYGLESSSMLYRYPQFEHVTPGLTGISESVCAMLEHDGYLYANTESSGDIFRSSDGSTWQKVRNGLSGTIGCGLAALDADL